jgi:hypothetical protein
MKAWQTQFRNAARETLHTLPVTNPSNVISLRVLSLVHGISISLII